MNEFDKMQLKFFNIESSVRDWSGFTAIIPSVCVGNVGQLAADLLISSMYLHKVGDILDNDVLPVVGNDPFSFNKQAAPCHLCTALEVYEGVGQKIVIIQQRAPFKKGHKKLFVSKLVKWLSDKKFGRIIILCGSFAHERRDIQLEGSQLRFKFSPQLEISDGEKVRHQLQWTELEVRLSDEHMNQFNYNDKLHSVFLPGCGIATLLFAECCKLNFPVGILSKFCEEGDNFVDAIQLASYINSWQDWVDISKPIDAASNGWRIPTSWCLLYGNNCDRTLYD